MRIESLILLTSLRTLGFPSAKILSLEHLLVALKDGSPSQPHFFRMQLSSLAIFLRLIPPTEACRTAEKID
jgi:hypothetical protein